VAAEISDAIGEIAGATRASGLREVAAASGDPLPPLPETSALAQRHKREDSDDLPIDDGIKRGVMLYDFDPQGDDELAVRQDQIVEILDDSHEEWWKCKAGSREGVVPASYVDVIKTRPANKKDHMGTSNAANALAAAVTSPRKKSSMSTGPPVQPSRQNLAKPDVGKVRTWTDRSGTFKVEAQFLGLSEGKIQLHKLNGVKISVPLTKMSVEDVQFVERLTGRTSPTPPQPPPDSEKPHNKKSDYDWYSFFLESGVDYNVCQRYAVAFERDQMDESILPDINPDTLRTLGVREGDILRIMKRLDDKFGRTSTRKKSVRFGGEEVVDEDEKDDVSDVVKITQPVERRESLFSSGPGGALRNNTQRRGRPTTAKAAPEEVDGTLLSSPVRDEEAEPERHGVRPLRVPPSRLANYTSQKASSDGFDDDAWAVKQERTPNQTQPPTAPTIQQPPAQTGPLPGSAMHELASINPQNMSEPLQLALQPQAPLQAQITPVQFQPTASPLVHRPSSVPPTQSAPQMQPLQPHYTGIPPQPNFSGPTPAQASGTQSLSEQLAKLQMYRQQQMLQPQQTGYIPQFQPQPTGYQNGYSTTNPQFQQTTGIPLQPQQTGYMPNFLPPGQQSSQLGQTRSTSLALPAPLIPTNTISQPQPQFITSHRTGPANFGPTPSQFQPQFQPQPTGFQSNLQPQQTGFQPQQQTGFQPQQTGYQPQPSFLPPSTILPQQTGFQQQMLPQQTGSNTMFKPVSFGTTPKPLVPSRTGKRANLAAASIIPCAQFLIVIAPENPFGF
jgi:actin cytoskeleton-regulatory complex protein SLA1